MKILVVIALSIFMLACACWQAEPQKARLIQPSEQLVNDIEVWMAKVLDVNRVTLAESAFQNSHNLVLERTIRQSMSVDLPPRFELLKQGDHCWIRLLDTQQRFSLPKASCVTQ